MTVILDHLSAGGAQILVTLQARYRHRINVQMDIISLAGELKAAHLFDDQVNLHKFDSYKLLHKRRFIQLYRLLGRINPDLIHCHLRMANTLGPLVGKLRGIPVVATLHSVHPIPYEANLKRDWAEKWMIRLFADRIVAVGPKVAQTHQTRFGRNQIRVLPNPVNIDGLREAGGWVRNQPQRNTHSARSLNLPFDTEGMPVVCCLARVIPQKGFPETVDVFEFARQQVPDLKLLVAGGGSYRAEMEQVVIARGLDDCVAFLGPRNDVAELLSVSDVLILASHLEGLPLSILEAMAMDVAVIATDVGDVRWVLDDGNAGVLISRHDLEDAGYKLARLVSDLDHRGSIVENARSRVESHFSLPRWLDGLRKIYDEVVNPAS